MAEVQAIEAPTTDREQQGPLPQELVSSEAQLQQAQQALQERDEAAVRLTGALAQAQESLQEQAKSLQQTEEALRRTLGQYRNALLSASPEVPPELVQGDTAEAVESSLAQAQQVVARIRQQMEAKLAGERVPPGAPLRSAPDASSLSPTEKILYGLRRLGG